MIDRFKTFYMDIADRTAQLSRAVRLKVGAVVVKNDSIISFGFNGTPSGWDNNCEDKDYMTDAGGWLDPNEIEKLWPHTETDKLTGLVVRYRLKTKPEVLHAEANALIKVARSAESTAGAVLFITHAPCIECAKLIYQSGIKQVFWRHNYRDESGINFLKQAGVTLNKVQE